MLEAFWIADAMLVALALFFAIVGGALLKSPFFMIAVGAGAGLLALHGYLRHRQRDEIALAPDYRQTRERRGF
jgi:hypothetical protein